jgi:phosphate transport system substrate-binding protein
MMNQVRQISTVASMIFLLTLAGVFPVSAGDLVRVVGSDSMAHNVANYAAEFCEGNSGCKVLVSGGAGEKGFEKMLSGEAEIGMASLRISTNDEGLFKAKGVTLQEAVIGFGGIVFITHTANPIDALSVDQLKKLLTGQVTNWKDVGGREMPVSVITASESERGGTFRFMTDDFMKGSYAPSARKLTYFRSVPPTVEETEGSLGVIRMRNLERLIEQGQDKKIKVIGVKKDERSPAITPSRESIDEGTYPVTRPFLLYIAKDKTDKCAVNFFKFCEARNPRPGAKK